ncbi:helix-turn-helix domain-containing protein [Roseobacter denitrificans]|nr:helix-turn-helix transcriptional regulator [Roseobacter denitrificans]
MEAYARVLRERRKAANLSQEELAFRTDLSMSYISFLETCRRQPTLTVMDAICRELGVSLTEFIGEVEGDVENNR